MSRVGVLAILLLAGFPATGTPFRGDQALFAISARDLANGAVLYRDVWDVTNPGIFGFYTLAGSLFGFSEDGIHLFEFLYWCAFVGTVCEFTRRSHGLDRWPLAPAFFLGFLYYWPSCSDPSQLTKVEGLVAFPMFVAMAAASRFSTRWAIVAGLAAGIVILFKFLFGACIVAGWTYLLAVRYRRDGAGATLKFAGGLSIGILAVTGSAVAYFAVHGAIGTALQTLFVDSRSMLAAADLAGFDRLANSVRWEVELYSAAFAIALVGSWKILRRKGDPFVVALAFVILASVGVVGVQRWSWWSYHGLLVGLPACTLAGYAWPAICLRVDRHTTRGERAVLTVGFLMLFLPAFGHGANAYRRLADGRAAARESAGQAYREAREIARWLDGRPGEIYVCGDPLVYWLAGRRPAVPISGWSLELYHPAKRAELARQLRDARPVAIFVASAPHGYDRILKNRYPELQTFIETEYIPSERTDRGTWFELRPTPTSAP